MENSVNSHRGEIAIIPRCRDDDEDGVRSEKLVDGRDWKV
jgi:hypothetical protein